MNSTDLFSGHIKSCAIYYIFEPFSSSHTEVYRFEPLKSLKFSPDSPHPRLISQVKKLDSERPSNLSKLASELGQESRAVG
jgi:hypothetical protein